jgi:hypothetical protein
MLIPSQAQAGEQGKTGAARASGAALAMQHITRGQRHDARKSQWIRRLAAHV